jgi:hypothetical protein
MHPILVYGYNDNKLFVADQFLGNKGRFDISTVTYQEFYNGFISAHTDFLKQNYFSEIYLIKYNSQIDDYDPNIFAIKSSLCNYFDSSYTNFQYRFPHTDYKYIKIPSGYTALTKFIEYFKQTAVYSFEHIRLLHELLTHAEIVHHTIDILQIQELKSISHSYINMCKLLRNSLMKDIVSNRTPIIDFKQLDEVLRIDYDIYKSLNQSLTCEVPSTWQDIQ